MRSAFIAFILFSVIFTSCSTSKHNDPVTILPTDGNFTQSMQELPARTVWGLWDITIDPDTLSSEVIPVRLAEFHLNATKLLEVNPCDSCLLITDVTASPPNRVSVKITVKHPYPQSANLAAFDARGIMLTASDTEFPGNGKFISYDGSNPVLTNPDGYTQLFNPTDFPSDGPGPELFKYFPGKWSKGGDFTSTLNPYVAFERTEDRRLFHSESSRVLELRAPGGPMQFGYAVDASWIPMDDVTDPLTDFPMTANSIEPYEIRSDIANGLKAGAGNTVGINIDVFDRQGLETIDTVTIECPELFAGTKNISYSEGLANNGLRFTGEIINETGMMSGVFPVLIRVIDTSQDTNMGQIDAWQLIEVDIIDGFAFTWGTGGGDVGYGIDMDAQGNVFVAGQIYGQGPEASLMKLDPDGNLLWAYTWGEYSFDTCYEVSINDKGYVFVVGQFGNTVDFDPTDTGEDFHTAQGNADCFLSCFSTNGQFQWARTWGDMDWGDPIDIAYSVATDNEDGVYVTGVFADTVDFDPGPGTDFHSVYAYQDAFLTKYNVYGDYQWTNTWGGVGYEDVGYGVAVDNDGGVYVAGSFEHMVDFDPSPEYEYTIDSNGDRDCYLSKFSSEGPFMWCKAWGGEESDFAHVVRIHPLDGPIVGGEFRIEADFDPDEDEEDIQDVPDLGAFVSRFTQTGDLMSAITWGGPRKEPVNGLAFDPSGNLYVAGYFNNTVDFDPGPGFYNRTSNGQWDAYVSKFDPSNNHLWTETWGGATDDRSIGLIVDKFGNVAVTGSFTGTVDFAPGAEVDEHETMGAMDMFLTVYRPDGTW